MKNLLINSLLILIIAGLIVSCTNTKPEIVYGFIHMVLYESETEPAAHYSFFIIADDDDGIENLDELYLYHDRDQLRWQINSDEWISYTQGEQNWIGTRSLTVEEGSLPKGVFRAVLVNKGGEKGERSFTYDGDVRFPFPEIEISNGYYYINSQWPSNRLVCYDRTGAYISTIELSSLSGSAAQLNLPSSVRTVALWAEDSANFCSAFTNVVPVN